MLKLDEEKDLYKAINAYEKSLKAGDYTENLSARIVELRNAIKGVSVSYQRDKHKFAVLDVCRKLHMIVTGALDNITMAESKDMADWLKDRVVLWESGKYPAYDEAVFRLACETIKEWDKTH